MAQLNPAFETLPHPWDPDRIGTDGVLAHLAKSFDIHVTQDIKHRQGMQRLHAALLEADIHGARPLGCTRRRQRHASAKSTRPGAVFENEHGLRERRVRPLD